MENTQSGSSFYGFTNWVSVEALGKEPSRRRVIMEILSNIMKVFGLF